MIGGSGVLAKAFAMGFACAWIVMSPAQSRGATRSPAANERIEPFSVSELSGRTSSIDALMRERAIVLITLDFECPVSQRYRTRVAEIARRSRARGIDFYYVDVTPHTPGEAKARAGSLGGVPLLLDPQRSIAAALRPASTAEAFLIDRRRTLRYRGAIDDQYGISHQRPRAQHEWLKDALEKVLAGEDPQVRDTAAQGCPLDAPKEPLASAVTYHNRVSRIIQSKCQICHRAGGLGPMPLENYAQVAQRGAVINLMVDSGRMPPWSAHKSIGEWANDRSLTGREKADLLGWIKAGAPEGDPKEAPLPRKFAKGWNIGKPDYVLPIPAPFKVPAEGPIEYKYVFAKTNLAEDQWITAIEIKPTQPKVVHHALAFLEEPGRKPLTPEEIARYKPGDKLRPLPNDGVTGFYAATVPGSMGVVFPPGTGKKLPKGAWIRFEIHYQPNGTEVLDRTEIGFRFSSKPLREVESRSAFNNDFTIPPQAPRHPVKGAYTFQKGGQLLSLFPHMHLRGTAFRYDLRYPDGKVVPLLDVPKFDFNWQSYYELAKPLDVPAGSQLLATAWYDNSRNNPWNPDPSSAVKWGQQTWEEMMIGYFDFVESR